MLRRRNFRNGLQFGNSNLNYGRLQASRSSGYDTVDYGHDSGGYKSHDSGYGKSEGYGHSGGGTYGHSGGGGYGHDISYGHSGGGGYGHSGGGGYGHSDSYGHDIGYHDSGYGHDSYGHSYGASYGGYGKMDCPGIPIALLLITLLGIGILGFILFTKINAAGRRKRSVYHFTNIPELLKDFEDVLTVIQFGR